MSYTFTVNDLSRISGISVETLQYYDQFGLLSPVLKSENGDSLYEENQLLDLQQIMLLREQRLPFNKIKTLLEEKRDHAEVLLDHKKRLMEKQSRIHSLIDTINYTLKYINRENEAAHQSLYAGFDLSQQNLYEEAAISAYEGADQPGDQNHTEQQWTKDDYLNTQREADEIYLDLCKAMEDGLAPDSPSVQQIIKRHFEWISHFYTPTKEIYSGLGDIYVEHEDFRQLYAGYHPRLAEYLRDSMKIYADQQM